MYGKSHRKGKITSQESFTLAICLWTNAMVIFMLNFMDMYMELMDSSRNQRQNEKPTTLFLFLSYGMRARVCVSLSSRTFQWRWWILNAECNKSSPNLEFNVTSWKYGMHATMVTFGQDQVNSTKRQEHEWILKWMRYHHIWLIYVCICDLIMAQAAFHGRHVMIILYFRLFSL